MDFRPTCYPDHSLPKNLKIPEFFYISSYDTRQPCQEKKTGKKSYSNDSHIIFLR